MRRYERASTLLTSNRPFEDWGKPLGDTAAVTALLDRLLHHAHVLTCGPRSWRNRLHGERATSGRHDIDDAARSGSERHDLEGSGYRSIPENAARSALGGPRYNTPAWARRLWPVLPRPRMAGFAVSTEASVAAVPPMRCRNLTPVPTALASKTRRASVNWTCPKNDPQGSEPGLKVT